MYPEDCCRHAWPSTFRHHPDLPDSASTERASKRKAMLRNYPPAAPPAEIFVSTSVFGPGGVLGPYKTLRIFLNRLSFGGAVQLESACSLHVSLVALAWSGAFSADVDFSLPDSATSPQVTLSCSSGNARGSSPACTWSGPSGRRIMMAENNTKRTDAFLLASTVCFISVLLYSPM